MVKALFLFPSVLFIILSLSSCRGTNCEFNRITNDLGNLSSKNSEISILNWRILGPYKDTSMANAVLSLSSPIDTLPELVHKETAIDTILQQSMGYFIDFQSLYGTSDVYCSYALSVITCKNKEEVAFLIGVDDNVRIWVNGEFVFGTSGLRGLHYKNDFIKKLTLEKGENVIIAEIDNTGGGECRFKLDVSSIEHVRKNALIDNYYNTVLNPVLGLKDSLHIYVSNPEFIPVTKPCSLRVYDIDRNLVWSHEFSMDKEAKIDLEGLNEGLYSYNLYTDKDTLEGVFVRGEIKHIYNKDSLLNTYQNDPLVLRLLQPYINRLDRLLNDASNGMDQNLANKVAMCLYKVCEINKGTIVKTGKGLDGWQIRSFVSTIDGSDDHYLLYIPKSKSGKPDINLPLVVVVPYVTGEHPFYTGAVVSNTERINYISKFAEQHGMAVIWPSSRVYVRYNLTPIIGVSIREAIDNAGHFYNFDRNNVFYYGDCSGGLFALIAAAHNPEGIKAIALEGPDLRPIRFSNTIKVGINAANDISTLRKNLKDIPIMILHSENDEVAPHSLSVRLADSLTKYGYSIVYDDLRNAAKATGLKLYAESESMKKVFEFFDRQTQIKKIMGRKSYSGHTLFNDTIYGVTVNKKHTAGKFSYDYEVQDKSFKLWTHNVSELNINLSKMGISNFEADYRIYINGQLIDEFKGTIEMNNENWKINIPCAKCNVTKDGYELRHPINAVLSSQFALFADSSECNVGALQQFNSIWQSEYLVKPETIANKVNFKGKHIVKFINDSTLRSLRKHVKGVKKLNEFSTGSVSYAHVSKLSNGQLQLVISLDANESSTGLLEYIITQGWESTIVWNNTLNKPVFQRFPE